MSFDPGDAVSRSLKMMDQFYVAMMHNNILKIQAFQYECFSTITEESYLRFCDQINSLAMQAQQLREDIYSIKRVNTACQTEAQIISNFSVPAKKPVTVSIVPEPVVPSPVKEKPIAPFEEELDYQEFIPSRQPNKRDILTCDYCELKFNSLEKMQQHVNIAHSEDFTSKIFPCQNCNLFFLSIDELKEHKSCVHDSDEEGKVDEDQLCPYCCEVKSNWVEYISHLQQEHQILVCNTCHTFCNDAETLEQHIQKSHMTGIAKEQIKDIMVPLTEPKPISRTPAFKRPFDDIGSMKKRGRPKRSAKQEELENLNCHFCSAIFNNEDSLRKHIVYKHDTGELQCHECNLKFRRTSAFENHMRLFHKKTKDAVKSPMSKLTSGKELSDQSGPQPLLQKLLLKAVKKEDTRKQMNLVKGQSKPNCEICGEMCGRVEDQEIHKDFHTTSQSDRFLCLFCTEPAMPQKELKTHIMSEHRYRCPFCALTFWWKSNLEGHLKQLHRTKNCCILCGLQVEGEELRQHIINIHTTKTYYICKVCNSEHLTLKDMSDHEKSHTRIGVSPPTCDFCGRAFGRKKSLKGHVMRHIYGSYSCSLCGVQCKTVEELHLHLGDHQKSQFACMCGEYFQTKVDLQLHQKNTPCKPFFNQPIHRADLFVEVCIEDTDDKDQVLSSTPATFKIMESQGQNLEDIYQINIAETPAQFSKNFLNTAATVNKHNQLVLPRTPILILNPSEGAEATLIENKSSGIMSWVGKNETDDSSILE